MSYEAQPSMKTWRERIQEARERGCFSTEDYALWMSPRMCLVGEATQNICGEFDPVIWVKIDNIPGGGTFQDGLGRAIFRNDFDFVEQRLDEIEDSAFLVKRGLK